MAARARRGRVVSSHRKVRPLIVDRLDEVVALLDDLERREAALLSWGITSGGFSQAELEERIATLCDDHEEVRDLIENLELAGLLARSGEPENALWRTRSAETIRLLSHLRQLFPKHRKTADGWRGAARLVADYRYAVRARSYPKRHIEPSQVLAALLNDGLTKTKEQFVEALIDNGNRRLKLADFQLRSTRQILSDLATQRSRGVVVGAGTGSGKTLAFYLPTLAWIADICDSARWTKALAIYPRKELLKDQFAQAYDEARQLDALLKRPLSIGAYYGDTPYNKKSVRSNWKRGPSGYVLSVHAMSAVSRALGMDDDRHFCEPLSAHV